VAVSCEERVCMRESILEQGKGDDGEERNGVLIFMSSFLILLILTFRLSSQEMLMNLKIVSLHVVEKFNKHKIFFKMK
jgi:hypothetical protein